MIIGPLQNNPEFLNDSVGAINEANFPRVSSGKMLGASEFYIRGNFQI